jgi:hypothetical protein
MPITKSYPVRFTPKGLCDAYDSTDAFPGACRSLSNLIFDRGNPELVVSRPGVGAPLTTFAGFTTPTFVSVFITVGNVVYGMVSSGRNAGNDEPFAYNLLTQTFTSVTGVTSANTPTSPATSGAWTPPTMAVISTKIIVTHPGFNATGTNFFGVIDISNPAIPTWSSTNLTTNPLPAVPSSVANFNNRAWYAVNNILYFSDVLVPTTRTNATQSLTLGDTTAITAQSGLPITTTSAGVIGALVVFKSSQIWQITGDSTTNNLALNYISLTTGCVAPRSVVQLPFGIVFAGIDAPYVLSFLGTLSALNSQLGSQTDADLQLPFQNATTPSRISASFSGNIYRVCVPTLLSGVSQTNDYWFDIRRMRWNGPHTFVYDCAAESGSSFILSGAGTHAALFQSASYPITNSVYNDNGTQLNVSMLSSTFPKTNHMAQLQVVESTLELSSSGASVNYGVTGVDEKGNTLNSTFVLTQPAGGVWGAFTWGSGVAWSSSVNVPAVYTIPWTAPLVFQKMALNIIATSSSSLSIGTFYARYQDTGYTGQG